MLERCLWTEVSEPPRLPASPLPDRTDVAIIGGGYTGLSAARRLGRRGIDAAVLEQHTMGWGASGRNGGFVLPGYKPEMARLYHRLGEERASRMFRLTLDAIAFLERLVAEDEISCDLVQCGAVTLAAKPGHLRGLEESGRFLQDRLGYA